ncbi:L,D-transpeptidase [Streptomyces sp. AK02-01A]|uniref:L,D-transpeptidase n=1 Tax=Streptomyces sp. AK02-01A TaxID=3028648 RepID=UPI0029A4D9A9|nr:Ig-like domain-containing protein [Streptomyces sp. AK02-01A]MDX3855502.1 Ig-like domain-containing protein [Streptomyces sp. AK02-01A]
MNHTPRFRTVLSCALLAMSLVAGATACGDGDSKRHPLSAKPSSSAAAGKIVFSGPTGKTKADPNKPLEVTARTGDGRITDVTAIDTKGHYLAGELAADGTRWHSTAALAAGTRYTVKVATESKKGASGTRTLSFDTRPAKKKLEVEFGPEAGEYGVGQPLTATLSEPVKSKAARDVVERALTVRSTPSAEGGAWYWVDDTELHYRPKEYWPANSVITASSNLDGVRVSNKLYGAATKPLKLEIGDRVEAIADASSHYMTVLVNGEEINNIPITTGKPGFSTRNGVKVVLGQEYYVQMRGTSVGIGGSEGYNLPVYYATRVTWSGEYVHAAPWSVGSQGVANVSHGCVGMSTANAAWFFETFRQGDLVEVINSAGDYMEDFGNGFGDWNVDWDEWREGSVLQAGTREGSSPVDYARLRPSI